MKKPLKLLSALLLAIPLLSSCSDMFKPKTMTIEYDEEVKLHDGSMIWVHITRHYFLAGEIAHGSAYMPSNVEISWDTGFKGVGRKSVFFDDLITFINKYEGKWYVSGGSSSTPPKLYPDSKSCKIVGVTLDTICVVTVNDKGEFIPANPNIVYKINKMNLIHPYGIDDWGLVPQFLDGKKISWNEKLSLEKRQTKHFRHLEKDIPVLTDLEKANH